MNNLEKGKIPPQAINLEEAILGALLIDKKALIEVEFLTPDMFYKESHQFIYQAILDVYISSNSVDLLTVGNQLRKKEQLDLVGGDYYIIQLTQKVSSSAHIEPHARIIVQKYIQRKLISNSADIIENSYKDNADVFDLLDNSYNKLNDISEIVIKKQEVVFDKIIDNVIERGIKIYNGEIKSGIETPIKNLTNKTGGFRDTELIILAARPGMGKTSFALSMAIEPAKKNIPVAFFSLEMSKEQLVSRSLSMEYKIDNKKFNISGLDYNDQVILGNDDKKIKQIPLYIDDTPALTIEQFQIKAKRLKSKQNIKLIIIDYLQLMTGKGNNREQEISKISRGLKKVAKELKIPVIALSQLSRAVETRGGSKRPLLSDLRESGAIEQDADMVMFLYRPEYYGLTEWDEDDYNRESTINQAEYIVAKNRNGGLVRNRMSFEGRYTLFSDLDNETYNDNEFNENLNTPNKDIEDAF